MNAKERDALAQKIDDFIQEQMHGLNDGDYLDVLDNVDDRVTAMIVAKSNELANGDDDDDDDAEDDDDSNDDDGEDEQ